jgi:hypothetical protein
MSTKEFINHVASSYPVLWVDTDEYSRAIDSLAGSLKDTTKHISYKWDFVSGISKVGETDKNGMPVTLEETTNDPIQPVDYLIGKCSERSSNKSNVMFVQDFHLYIKSEQIWRKILNHIPVFKQTSNILVIVSPIVDIPPEIQRYVTVLDFSLPDREELKEILSEAVAAGDSGMPEGDILEDILNCGTGLTAFEFENAIYHSMVSNKGNIVAKSIHEQKQQLIRKSAAMQVTKSDTGFEMIAGLDNLKDFVPRMVGKKDARGIMIVGVPGGGKSAFAKALGKETNRMTIELEIGNLQGGIVGDTERQTREAFKVIDAMEPAILFIDEIDTLVSLSREGQVKLS